MSRTKGSKNKSKDETPVDPPKKVHDKPYNAVLVKFQNSQKELLDSLETDDDLSPPLEGYDLYDSLRAAGFPQGGSGNLMYDENGNNPVYVPHPSEIYQMFIGDPAQWDEMRDSMARSWLKNREI